MSFDIESEFQAYCRRVRLDLDSCSPVQVIETRRAFHGAIGQMLVFMRNEMAEMSEDQGVAELDRLWGEVKSFWERQAGFGRNVPGGPEDDG